MSTTLEVVTYAEVALSTSFSVPVISEGLHDRISTHNPLASLFAEEVLKFSPFLCNFFPTSSLGLENLSSEGQGRDRLSLFCQIFGFCFVNLAGAGR